MIQTLKLLICDEDHGAEVCFPASAQKMEALMRRVGTVQPFDAHTLRVLARKNGWRHSNGRDLCPMCSGHEDEEIE